MAQGIPQGGGLKLLSTAGGGGGDRVSLLFEHPYHCRFGGARSRIDSKRPNSISSSRIHSRSFGVEEQLGVGGDADSVGEEDEEFYYEEEFELEREDELSRLRGLVLDTSYRPVNVVCWKRAICLEFMDKADVLEYYDRTVDSPGGSYYIPAVLRVPHLLQVVKRRRIRQQLSRKNIFFRDSFTCQYCSSRENLTIDHVLPISRGGEWIWENLVTACARCNSKKGHKTLDEINMKLIKLPKAPKDFDIFSIPLTTSSMKSLSMRKNMPNEWRDYLGKLP